MKNVLRIVATIIALVLALSLFAACNGNGNGNGKGNGDLGADTGTESGSDKNSDAEPGSNEETDSSGNNTENDDEQSESVESDESESNTDSESKVEDDTEEEKLYVREGDYIYFGEYPQTLKADDVDVPLLPEDNGYYLGSDGCYYVKINAHPYQSGYRFSTGLSVVDGWGCYFKIEPLRWRILTEKDGKALIFCDSIIDNQYYEADDQFADTANNNYSESKVRQWLIETFYNTAFNDLEKELIQLIEVDNSLASTGMEKNNNICENTFDKVFLLSFADVSNPEYGFAEAKYNVSGAGSMMTQDPARMIKASDYAIAVGAAVSTSPEYYGCGWWWLRTPDNGGNKSTGYAAGLILSSGMITFSSVYEKGAVVPAMWIEL